jgi:hypothetical protein
MKKLLKEELFMERLLKALEELYAIQDNGRVCDYDGKTYFESNEVTSAVICLCDEKLITEGGRCDWDNIDVLRKNGYRVFAGDRDSFGWLTGCVQKKGDPRILVYG